jgi:hypothetical protein
MMSHKGLANIAPFLERAEKLASNPKPTVVALGAVTTTNTNHK